MTAIGPTIETARLILRPPGSEELEAVYAFAADEETNRYLGGAKGRAEAWRGWASIAGSWVLKGFGMFSMIRKQDGVWVGRAGPWRPEGWPGTEVGWGVAPAFAGQGYAREAAVAAIDWAFEHLGWSEVIHTIDPENAPSIALAERLGSTNRGPTRLPPPFAEARVDAYGQTRAQWQHNRQKFL